MKSVSCTKLLLGQSLILSYFLPALDVSRVHLLHHNQHLGPQLQAQHLVSVRGRISQLMTVNQCKFYINHLNTKHLKFEHLDSNTFFVRISNDQSLDYACNLNMGLLFR
jgi:hypothetical protein